MRVIGEIKGEAAARVFGDFLHAQGIASEIESGADAAWTVWVRSDDDCQRSAELLAAFLRNPDDPRFATAASDAAEARRRAEADLAVYRRRVKSARTLFPSLKGYRFGPLTYLLILISVGVFIATSLGENFEPVNMLWFSEYAHAGSFWRRIVDLPELRQGQIWRLVTPIFIHMGLVHIVFNMMWLADLGSMIEGRQSTGLLSRLVLGLAVGSNVVQYMVTGHPHFGGMSGVVYGLIGYMWIRGKYDPGCGLRLHQQTVVMSIVWFFLCFTGWLGPVANGAHAGGLAMGMAWGWLAGRRA